MNLFPITLLVLSRILCADGNIFDHMYRKSEPEPQPEPEPEQNIFPKSSHEVQLQHYRYAPRAQVCLNSRTFEKYFDGKQRSCQKIRLNADRRNRACSLWEFNNNCPQTCGKCCEDNPEYIFVTKLGTFKRCGWLSEKLVRQDRYCKTWNSGRMVRDACPAACQFCFKRVLAVTPKPSVKPSAHPSAMPSIGPSAKPTTQPSALPTSFPSTSPSDLPSREPSDKPSDFPSDLPSNKPSDVPSKYPSLIPSSLPSKSPSTSPTINHSDVPSGEPNVSPSSSPTINHSGVPSEQPSDAPSDVPSKHPSDEPSDVPSKHPSDVPSDVPSKHPSDVPSDSPSKHPSDVPSDSPSELPTSVPSSLPSDSPSKDPSTPPSDLPSSEPSISPSDYPSKEPSVLPSSMPSIKPSDVPSDLPSDQPSKSPTDHPSKSPTDKPSPHPTRQPSKSPTVSPSAKPTISSKPTKSPTPDPTDSPTVSPTACPTSSCKDDETHRFVLDNGSIQNCAWLTSNFAAQQSRIEKYCPKLYMQRFCPVSCNNCDSNCVDDPDFTWELDNSEIVGCDWFTRNELNKAGRLEKYCPRLLYGGPTTIKDMCRAACWESYGCVPTWNQVESIVTLDSHVSMLKNVQASTKPHSIFGAQ